MACLLLDVVETEVLRGILTPIGHGVWTAILGGAMFAAASRPWRLGAIAALLGWYLVAALLHAFWDASAGIAVWLTPLLTNTPSQWLIIGTGHAPTISAVQVHIYTILSWVLLGWTGFSVCRYLSERTAVTAANREPQKIATAKTASKLNTAPRGSATERAARAGR
jgi:hypothetical protein